MKSIQRIKFYLIALFLFVQIFRLRRMVSKKLESVPKLKLYRQLVLLMYTLFTADPELKAELSGVNLFLMMLFGVPVQMKQQKLLFQQMLLLKVKN